MRVSVKKWGNSTSVRIPSAVLHAAHLDLDQTVDIREEGGRIIIEPLPEPTYDLKSLVAGITKANLHGETATGASVGREVWLWLLAMCRMPATLSG